MYTVYGETWQDLVLQLDWLGEFADVNVLPRLLHLAKRYSDHRMFHVAHNGVILKVCESNNLWQVSGGTSFENCRPSELGTVVSAMFATDAMPFASVEVTTPRKAKVSYSNQSAFVPLTPHYFVVGVKRGVIAPIVVSIDNEPYQHILRLRIVNPNTIVLTPKPSLAARLSVLWKWAGEPWMVETKKDMPWMLLDADF
jgi:hypothetical protein